MKLTITTFRDDLFTLEVPKDIELENFKAYCEVESGLPAAHIALMWNGNPLTDDKKSIDQYGIADGDMLFLHPKQPPEASGVATIIILYYCSVTDCNYYHHYYYVYFY